MKRLALTFSALLLGTAAASAADMAPRYTKAPPLPVVAAYDWSGFYVGINGGGGSSRSCWDLTNNLGVPFVPPVAEGCHNATGGTVGGQVGYRWQANTWVFGVEAQGNWADFTGSNRNLFFLADDHSKVEAFGLFTGQVGYAINNVLLYLKGGAAVVSNKYSTTDSATGVLVDTARETRWGGVVGGGVEFGFAPNWSVALEYDHVFLDTHDVNAYGVGNFGLAPGQFSATDRIRQDIDIGTVRVNYRFGGPVVAKF